MSIWWCMICGAFQETLYVALSLSQCYCLSQTHRHLMSEGYALASVENRWGWKVLFICYGFFFLFQLLNNDNGSTEAKVTEQRWSHLPTFATVEISPELWATLPPPHDFRSYFSILFRLYKLSEDVHKWREGRIKGQGHGGGADLSWNLIGPRSAPVLSVVLNISFFFNPLFSKLFLCGFA